MLADFLICVRLSAIRAVVRLRCVGIQWVRYGLKLLNNPRIFSQPERPGNGRFWAVFRLSGFSEKFNIGCRSDDDLMADIHGG